jgi:hypothetical protein
VGIDSLVKLSAKFFGGNFFPWRRQALQQLKDKIGALRLGQRKCRFEELVLRHAHGLIISAAFSRRNT